MAKSKKPEQAIFYQNFKGAIYGGTPEQVKNLMTAYRFLTAKLPPLGGFFHGRAEERLPQSCVFFTTAASSVPGNRTQQLP